ncbi:hypothetical protein B9K09_17255 [Pseudomonas sp. M30-35]|nr:hypothetical protein [Pseudomonas sp. M30-35]ARU89609.1 hypothetical protein B9K09_17255 [Pseudomonas sp. M30-35]
MMLQMLWSLFTAYPRRTVNALALFFALAGGLLLLMTRIREQRAIARMLASDVDARVNESAMIDVPTQRLNQFFYGFASAALLFGLLLSEASTQL